MVSRNDTVVSQWLIVWLHNSHTIFELMSFRPEAAESKLEFKLSGSADDSDDEDGADDNPNESRVTVQWCSSSSSSNSCTVKYFCKLVVMCIDNLQYQAINIR